MKYHRLTKLELKQLMQSFRVIATSINVTIILTRLKNSAGEWNREQRKISLCKPIGKRYYIPISSFISAFFHELSHQINHDTGKYPIFHKTIARAYIKPPLAFRLTAFKAEYYTDKQAKKLMKLYFPNIPFHIGYTKSNLTKKRVREYYSF